MGKFGRQETDIYEGAPKRRFGGAGRAIKWLFVLAAIVALAAFTVPDPDVVVGVITTTKSDNYVTISYRISNAGASFATNVVMYVPVDKTLTDNTPPYVFGHFSAVPSSEWFKIGFGELDNEMYSVLMFDAGWLASKYIPYGSSRDLKIAIYVKDMALITTIGEGKLVYSNVIGSTRETAVRELPINIPGG
jgi:hypothetical protein